LRSFARRLLPVLTFSTGLGLCLAAMPGQPALAAATILPAGDGPAPPRAAAGASNLSGQVRAIPGSRKPARGLRSSASGTAPVRAVVTNPPHSPAGKRQGRLAHVVQADVLLVAQKPLPEGLVKRVRRVDGVAAAV